MTQDTNPQESRRRLFEIRHGVRDHWPLEFRAGHAVHRVGPRQLFDRLKNFQPERELSQLAAGTSVGGVERFARLLVV